jgi:hypothetical protein
MSFFNFTLLRSILSNYEQIVNFNPISDYLFFYFTQNDAGASLGNNLSLFKSQYRPMRKGIANMIRLHGTGAMALPTEIRLQILASSKDVIHS